MLARTQTLAMVSVVCGWGVSAQTTTQIDLNYNFNGIVHFGEDGTPDDPDGYRSISDRGLDFTAGVPSDPILDNYKFVTTADTLDLVHLGNRNTVDFGNRPFDADGVDADAFGVQPNWLADPDQTGPQTTTLGAPILLDGPSSASFLFQASNGGATFEVVFGFQGGGSTTATLTAPDWFGPGAGAPNIGAFPGTENTDFAQSGATLLITEQVVDLNAFNGSTLESITFQNGDNANAGIAVLAANVEVVPEPGSLALLGLGGLLAIRRRHG